MTNQPQGSDSPSSENLDAGFGSTATLPPPPPPPAAPPAPPVRYRRNRSAIFFGLVAGALAAILVVVIAAIAIGVAVIAGIASGDISVETDRVAVDIAPTTLAELPSTIVEEDGAIQIDLTGLDVSDFGAADAPVELDVRAEAGRITVVVPDGLDVSVDATSDLGDITVFGESDDGFNNTVLRQHDEADLALDLDLNVGKIEVVRG